MCGASGTQGGTATTARRDRVPREPWGSAIASWHYSERVNGNESGSKGSDVAGHDNDGTALATGGSEVALAPLRAKGGSFCLTEAKAGLLVASPVTISCGKVYNGDGT